MSHPAYTYPAFSHMECEVLDCCHPNLSLPFLSGRGGAAGVRDVCVGRVGPRAIYALCHVRLACCFLTSLVTAASSYLLKNTTHYSPPVEDFALNAMRNAGPGAQAMSLTPPIARGPGEGNTLARPPSPPSLHAAAHRTPLTPDLEDQQEKGVHERRHPNPCPCYSASQSYVAHSRSARDQEGNILLPRQMLPCLLGGGEGLLSLELLFIFRCRACP